MPSIAEAMAIKTFLESRNISQLFHFTHNKNLTSIVKHGLLTVTELQQLAIPFRNNDPERLDKELDAISVSIGFPNYSLFFRLRQGAVEADWRIVAISPSVLWTKPCLFCATNAANSGERAIERNLRTGLTGLTRIFADGAAPAGKSRVDLGIPEQYPTDPQAEVLVFGGIDPIDLLHVYRFTEMADLIDPLRETIGGVEIRTNDKLFGPRIDCCHWPRYGSRIDDNRF